MTTIIVTQENNELDEYDFDVEVKTITIGRRSTNDVCIPHLSVSGNHARISISDSGSLVEDLNSTNGTYINGRLISRQLLNDGDDIVIGKARVTFLQPERKNTDARPSADLADMADDEHPASEAAGSEDEAPLTLAEKAALHRRQTAADNGRSLKAANKHSGEADSHPSLADESVVEFDDSLDTDTPVRAKKVATAKVAAAAAAVPAASMAASSVASTKMSSSVVSAPDNYQADYEQDESIADGEILTGAYQSDQNDQSLEHDLDNETRISSGAVIEIKNGAKSGQVLPIDKPVTTLGRPGIQIAAIMKKPEGYFLMHIESENNVDRPKLNDDSIGDEPVLLNSGDSLNVAGIDVQFMLS